MYVNDQRLKTSPVRSGKGKWYLLSKLQHFTSQHSHSSKARKRNKRHKNWERRSVTFLNVSAMIIGIQNLKESPKQWLEYVNLATSQNTKLIQNSLVFLYFTKKQ